MTTDVMTLAAFDDCRVAVSRERRMTQQPAINKSRGPALPLPDQERSFSDASKMTLKAAELEQLVSRLNSKTATFEASSTLQTSNLRRSPTTNQLLKTD